MDHNPWHPVGYNEESVSCFKVHLSSVDIFFAFDLHYIGYLQKNELEKWYQLVDIGVLPSYSEQCSYTGIEMMMYSLPIVASDGFGVRIMSQIMAQSF